MGELASESQGSKELGKTPGWEEGLEAPRITGYIRQVWRAGARLKTRFYLLNKKSSFKMSELVRCRALR